MKFSGGCEQDELQRQPEVQELLRKQGERHWESWLDTRLPALGNRMPRHAAGAPEGRERLEALFADVACLSEREQNPMSPDLTASAGEARVALRDWDPLLVSVAVHTRPDNKYPARPSERELGD